MDFIWIVAGLLAVLGVGFFLVTYLCFRLAFYVPDRTPDQSVDDSVPEGKIYEPYWDKIRQYAKEAKEMPHEEFSIQSFDGLTLYGKYYEYQKGAPIELMFHGYRGSAERDLAGGAQRCFRLGRNAFIVSQRCSGKSEGNVITFGIKEQRDCLCWVDFLIKQFGPEVKIILTGISMGASTVLMASGKELPENVIGVLADCGYDSPKRIIKKVIGEMKLPVELGYFFVKLGAKLYGGFDLESDSPLESLKHCKLPVIFFHGTTDAYVPFEMSERNFEVCPGKKRLVAVPNAGHGLSYLVDPDGYFQALEEFFAEETNVK